MTTLKTKIAFLLCCVLTLSVLACTSAKAATPEEILASIEAGVDWLVAQQQPDGSWGGCPSRTGFAVIKLEELAFEAGFDSPFNPAYKHHVAVETGLNFIFRTASIIAIAIQPAGDPDSDGDGIGIAIEPGWDTTYNTGICMMAISASRAPDRVVGPIGSAVDGWTYKQVLGDMVDYMAFGQTDSGSRRGGWGYSHNQSWVDNSNSGYAVLGLGYAEAAYLGFNCTVPQFVKNELSLFIDYIQTDGGPDDGGSGYGDPGEWVNILKTGNLIFEMKFVGDPTESNRLQRALAYLGRKWNEANQDPGWKGPPPHYQSMYCVMKGLQYAGIETIDVGGSPVDWYSEFADAIVSNQQPDGRWPSDYWGDAVLATEWALLTLEAIAPPPPPPPFGQCVYQCNDFEPMNLDEFWSEGTPPLNWTHEAPTHVTLTIEPGNVLTVDYNHEWYGEETILFHVTDNLGWSYDVYVTFTVIGVPVVGDIPDQTTPFEPFDLDNYLTQMAPEDVEWTASAPPAGWTVQIDADNVVTVTAPEDATEAATITFTATNAVCPGWWLALPGNVPPSDSDDATFMPKKPMKWFMIEKAEINWASVQSFGNKNIFVISGNFALPQDYQRADLDRLAMLSIQIAGKEAKDKVAFRDLGLAWAYVESDFDGGLGQGIDIKKFDISWSNSKGSFYVKGELSLAGIGPDTKPREAMVALDIGGAPPVTGKETIKFEKEGNIWYYGSAPNSGIILSDDTQDGSLGGGTEHTVDLDDSEDLYDETDEWDAWIDELFYFEYLAASEDPWLDEHWYEDSATWEDPWLDEPLYENSTMSEDIWLDELMYEDFYGLEDLWLDELLRPLP